MQRQAQIHHLAGKRDGRIEPLGSACDDGPVAQTVRVCILASLGEGGEEKDEGSFSPSLPVFFFSLLVLKTT